MKLRILAICVLAVMACASFAGAEDKNYIEVDVKYRNGDIELTGTLTVPKASAPVPAVYLIPGASPFDRDMSLFGHKPFRTWAEHFAARGVAVLRMDDRGVGESGGVKFAASLEDLARDVVLGIEFLAGRNDIDGQRIGVMGHSQGAMLAPMVAARVPQVAFVVMLSGAGTSFPEVIAMSEAFNGTGEMDVNLQLVRSMMKTLDGLAPDKDAAQAVDKNWDKIIETLDGHRADQAREFTTAFSPRRDMFIAQPMFRDLLLYDPRERLADIRCPVLALSGTHDFDIASTLPQLASALHGSGNADYSVRKAFGMNHMMQKGANDQEEWSKIDHAVSPDVLDLVTEWLLDRLGGGS